MQANCSYIYRVLIAVHSVGDNTYLYNVNWKFGIICVQVTTICNHPAAFAYQYEFTQA